MSTPGPAEAGPAAALRFDRFGSAALEGQFQRGYLPATVHACQMWAATQVVVVLMNILGSVYYISTVLSALYWVLFTIQGGCIAAVLLLTLWASIEVYHLRNALCLCYCLSVASMGAQLCLLMQYHRDRSWNLLQLEPTTFTFIDGLMSCFTIAVYYIFQQLMVFPFLQIGYCPASVITLACGPMIYVVMTTVGFPLYVEAFGLLPSSFIVFLVQVYYTRRVAVLRRAMFLLELQKAQHTREMQEADSIVNHIVKNMMVEAAGLTETFLDLCTPPPPEDFVRPYLHCALERLRNGMAWCKRRRALLELLNPEAKARDLSPHTRTPTSLSALGTALVSHRTMTTNFVDLVVELDEALTDMMLENAISNAFRHGHPSDPDVRFFITADVPVIGAPSCTVTFRITNRSAPGSQPLTPQLVDQLRRNDPDCRTPHTPLSRGLGLRHCFLAAQLQGMTVSLAQEGDLVVFQASVVTRVVDWSSPQASPSPATTRAAPLPPGVRIAVIDDSASARTLLCHQLRHDVPGCIVSVFGASVADVEPFLAHAMAAADIAVLDQHLDWPSGSLCLGTDIVRLLLQAGFPGLVCIRSANMSEQDMQHYLAAGAHCVLDKLLDRTQTTATLAQHYWHFFSKQPQPPQAQDTTAVKDSPQPQDVGHLPGTVASA